MSIDNQAIRDLSASARAIASAITSNAAPNHDAAGVTVESLTEAVMGVTAGLLAIAQSLDGVADAINGVADSIREKQQ